MLFGAIRSKGGSNNNPNAAQFKAAYKRLLKVNDVICSADTNCTDFQRTISLPVHASKDIAELLTTYELNQASAEIPSTYQPHFDHQAFLADPIVHSHMMNIAQTVQRKLHSGLKCSNCITRSEDLESLAIICKYVEIDFKVKIIIISFAVKIKTNNF